MVNKYKTSFQPLSSEESQFLEYSTSKGNLAICVCPGEYQKLDLLIHSVSRNLFLKRSCLIIYEEENEEKIIAHFSKSNLSQYSYRIKDSGSFELITDRIKPSKDKEILKESIIIQSKLNQIEEKLNFSFLNILRPVFGDFDFAKIIELYYLSSQDNQIKDISIFLDPDSFEFEKNEFWRIRGKIEKASKNFKAEYLHLKYFDQLNDQLYLDYYQKEKEQKIHKNFDLLLLEVNELLNDYKSTLSEIRQNLLFEYQSYLRALERENAKLRYLNELYWIEFDLGAKKSKIFAKNLTLEKYKKSLREQVQQINERLGQYRLLDVDPLFNNWTPDTQKISEYSKVLQEKIEDTYSELPAFVNKQIEIINEGNSKLEAFENLNQRFEEFTKKIDEAKLFKLERRQLGISAQQNYQVLKEIRNKLFSGKEFLRTRKSYCIWRNFELSLEKRIYNLLVVLYEVKVNDWVKTFEKWYFKSIIEKQKSLKLKEGLRFFSEFHRLKLENCRYENLRLDQIIEHLSNRLSKKDRTSFQYLKKSIYSGDIDHIDNDILQSESHLVPNLFPVLLCPSSKTHFLEKIGFPSLILVDQDVRIFSKVNLAKTETLSAFHKKPLNSELLEKFYALSYFNRKKQFFVDTPSLDEIHIYNSELKNRINFARTLGKILKKSKYELNFYSAKEFSIIACLSPFISQILEISLNDRNIKKLKFQLLDSGIVEDIILKEEDKKYLLVQDLFWMPEEKLDWQIFTLNKLKNSGLEVIHVDSQQLLNFKGFILPELFKIPIGIEQKVTNN